MFLSIRHEGETHTMWVGCPRLRLQRMQYSERHLQWDQRQPLGPRHLTMIENASPHVQSLASRTKRFKGSRGERERGRNGIKRVPTKKKKAYRRRVCGCSISVLPWAHGSRWPLWARKPTIDMGWRGKKREIVIMDQRSGFVSKSKGSYSVNEKKGRKENIHICICVCIIEKSKKKKGDGGPKNCDCKLLNSQYRKSVAGPVQEQTCVYMWSDKETLSRMYSKTAEAKSISSSFSFTLSKITWVADSIRLSVSSALFAACHKPNRVFVFPSIFAPPQSRVVWCLYSWDSLAWVCVCVLA